MKNHPVARWAVLLFIVNFGLRLSLISKGPFDVDCLNLAQQAEQTIATLQLHYLFGTGYPLTVLLGAVFVGLCRSLGITDPVFAVNLMSVVLSSATVSLLYIFVNKMLGLSAALFSAILLAVFPLFLGLSVYGMSHTPSLFFLFLGLLFLVRAHEQQKSRLLFGSAVAFGCMGASRLQDFTLFLLPLTLFYFLPPSPLSAPGHSLSRRIREFFIAGLVCAGVILLFHLLLILPDSRSGEIYLAQLRRYCQASLGANFLGIYSSSLLESGQQLLFGLTPVGTLAALLGILLLLRNNLRLALFFIAWLMIPLFFVGNLSMTTARFLLIVVPPFIISAGYYFSYLSHFNNRFFRLFSLSAFSIIVFILLKEMVPVLLFRHTQELLPDFGRYVGKITEPTAQIITGDEGPFILYYGNRVLLTRPKTAAPLPIAELQAFQFLINKKISTGTPVYMTASGLYSYDPEQTFSAFIKRHYELQLAGNRLSEDWHQGPTRLRTGEEKLFRLIPKK